MTVGDPDPLPEPQPEFVPEAAVPFIRDKVRRLPVPVRIEENVSASLLETIHEAWIDVLYEALRRLDSQRWPQDWQWDWRDKFDYYTEREPDARFVAVIRTEEGSDREHAEGLMLAGVTGYTARVLEQQGRPMVYVHYLISAPWNRPDLVAEPRFTGIGSLLIARVVELSRKQGAEGRIGLHSLPQADAFYRQACGMTDMGIDESAEGLRYFEMTPEQASHFLSGR